jgi:hypothetical protein
LHLDGNTTLTFKVIVVKVKVISLLVLAKQFCLMKHFIDQGSFAVVNVRDNGYVAYVCHAGLENKPRSYHLIF